MSELGEPLGISAQNIVRTQDGSPRAHGSAETDGGQGVAAGFEEVVVRVHGHAQVIDGLTSPDQWECRLNAPPRREAGELAVVRLRFRPSR
ncbi:hypothetical protein [Streptomyces olindensis]|uniref:hypothetical protein n=1 Tax=Streptomyces olindensis TaxID=358823 RepID=UPI003647B2A8